LVIQEEQLVDFTAKDAMMLKTQYYYHDDATVWMDAPQPVCFPQSPHTSFFALTITFVIFLQGITREGRHKRRVRQEAVVPNFARSASLNWAVRLP
jgi:hypothetical protein